MSDEHELTEADFLRAMKEMNTVIDVATEDLVTLYRLARTYADLRHAEGVRIADVMTRDVVTVSPECTLADAAKRFLLNHVRSMPVVEGGERLVGMLTEADLLAAIGLPCHHPACSLWHKLQRIFSHARHVHGLSARVRDAMSDHPVTVRENETLHDVIETMRKHRVKTVPVTDARGRVRGIVTRSDIVRAFVQPKAGAQKRRTN